MANNNHFLLTLDTLAPTGSIARPAEYLKDNMNMTITKDSTAVYMKVWFDNTAVGTKDSDGYRNAEWIAAADSYKTEFNQTSGGLYYHLVLMDDVANESEVYNTEVMIYDTLPPVITSAALFDRDSLDTTLVNETTIGYRWACELNPAPAPIVKAIITGTDIEDQEVAISGGVYQYEGTLSFKAGTTDGVKTVTIKVQDAAGNISAPVTASITLDTQLDAPIITITGKDGNSISEWINYHEVTIALRCNDSNIIGYKIWEGANEPEDWTTQAAGTLSVTVPHTFSEGDGEKVIHAKVQDAALNDEVATPVTVKIDKVKPEISIATDKTLISKVVGFDTAVLTLSGSDDRSGITSYTLKVGEETISSGEAVPASFDLTAANSLAEGLNTITLTATDKAGNTDTKTVNVTLDTTAPANVTIGTLNAWYNTDFGIQLNYEDAHIGAGKGEIAVWTSELATDTSAPTDIAKVLPTNTPQDISHINIGGTKIQSANNYVHAKVTDEVGNVSYAHAKFGWDNVAPDAPIVTFSKAAYNSTAGSISIIYSDSTSGISHMQVTGDLTNGQTTDTWVEAASTYGVTFTSDNGDKNIYVKVKDKAGNISETSTVATAELDMSAPGVTVNLLEADGVTSKPNHSPLDTIAIKVAVTDDDVAECEYKIYGDVTEAQGTEAGITEEAAAWTPYVETDGKKYILVTNLYATGKDGTKEIYIVVRDNAGNTTAAEKLSFVLDTAAPIVVVSNPDYNRISKIHVLRRNSTGEIAGKFADEVSFTFTPDSFIQAYKVCAYKDQAAALAGNPAVDAAIGIANGSTNMSATGLSSNAEVSAKIKGADYEAALGGVENAGDLDGIHYVVVYVQDYAGTWSVAANFTA